MSEYLHAERPFLDQLVALGWQIIDQRQGFIPSDLTKSPRFVARLLDGHLAQGRIPVLDSSHVQRTEFG